jgi:hypothetical protein
MKNLALLLRKNARHADGKILNLIRYSRNTGTSTGKRKIIALFSEKARVVTGSVTVQQRYFKTFFPVHTQKNGKNSRNHVEKIRTKMYIAFPAR